MSQSMMHPRLTDYTLELMLLWSQELIILYLAPACSSSGQALRNGRRPTAAAAGGGTTCLSSRGPAPRRRSTGTALSAGAEEEQGEGLRGGPAAAAVSRTLRGAVAGRNPNGTRGRTATTLPGLTDPHSAGRRGRQVTANIPAPCTRSTVLGMPCLFKTRCRGRPGGELDVPLLMEHLEERQGWPAAMRQKH